MAVDLGPLMRVTDCRFCRLKDWNWRKRGAFMMPGLSSEFFPFNLDYLFTPDVEFVQKVTIKNSFGVVINQYSGTFLLRRAPELEEDDPDVSAWVYTWTNWYPTNYILESKFKATTFDELFRLVNAQLIRITRDGITSEIWRYITFIPIDNFYDMVAADIAAGSLYMRAYITAAESDDVYMNLISKSGLDITDVILTDDCLFQVFGKPFRHSDPIQLIDTINPNNYQELAP